MINVEVSRPTKLNICRNEIKSLIECDSRRTPEVRRTPESVGIELSHQLAEENKHTN